MVWVGLPWLVGLWMAAAFPESVTVYLLLAALLLGAFRLFRRIDTKQLLCAGTSFALAVTAFLLYTDAVYRPVVQHAGEQATFLGRVTAVREYDGGLAQVQLRGRFSDGVRAKILVFGDACGARLGDDMEVCGTFSQPEDSYLWHSGDNYRSQSIFLEVEKDAEVTLLPAERWKLLRMLQAYRERISMRIQVLAGTDAGGLVSAMLLGTKDTLTDTTDEAFVRSGIRHVAAVSGLHVVLILTIWTWLSTGLRFGRRSRFLGAAAVVLLYAAMVSAPISILRAGLMFLLMQSAPLFYRQGDTMTSLCFAGIVLTMWNPYLIQNISFLLSMAGTFGIGVFAPWLTKRMPERYLLQKVGKKLAALACVSVCIFPISLLYFREVSVVSPLANLILVPICSLMVVLAMVIFLTGGIGWIAEPICGLLRLLYQLIMLLIRGLEHLVPMMFPTGWRLLPVLTLLLCMLVLLTAFLWRKPRIAAMSVAGSFLILTVGQALYQTSARREFVVTLMGQKDAVTAVIQFQGKTDVIDLSGSRDGAYYVQAYLAENGVRRVDSLCLTKRADQLRVTYGDALRYVSIGEMVLPESSVIPAHVSLPCETLVQTDDVIIEDTLYQIKVEDQVLKITYGTLHFCIGSALEKVPNGEWDVLICSSWHGDAASLPEEAYVKDEVTQLRVTASGNLFVENLY